MSESPGLPKVTFGELCSWLWEGANILRGPVEHADFKTYLFPLLFLKRVNDVWEEERNAAIAELGEHFSENHRFQIPDGAHWEDIRSSSKNVGQVLQSSMRDIESSNPQLEGIFGDAQWSNKDRFTDELLKDIIEHFSKYSLGREVTQDDLVGQAYEWTIKKFADIENKAAGEFYTPRSVIGLMVQILKPKQGDSIYDPACGTGGMLLEAARYIRKNGDLRSIYGNIYGQEKNFTTSSMARANLYLHGLEDFSIVNADTLRKPAFVKEGELRKFDLVIANPPFSLKKWGQEEWKADLWGRNKLGIPPNGNGDYAWIQHMLSSVNDTGRMAIVLPQGVLYRTGKESEIRERIVKSDDIECIIGLAPNIFYGANVSACMLIINKNKPLEKRNKIMFIDATKNFCKGKSHNLLLDKHASAIFQLYDEWENVEAVCKVCSLDEIADRDFNLNVFLYLEPKGYDNVIFINDALEMVRTAHDTYTSRIDEFTKCNSELIMWKEGLK